MVLRCKQKLIWYLQFGLNYYWTDFPVAQIVKHLSIMQETWVWPPGREDSLEKEMAIHSSTIAWKIPWTEEPGRLYSPRGRKESDTELQKVTLLWHTWSIYCFKREFLFMYYSIVTFKQKPMFFFFSWSYMETTFRKVRWRIMVSSCPMNSVSSSSYWKQYK